MAATRSDSSSAASVREVLQTAPAEICGFPAFAPELSAGNRDFPPDLFSELAAVEERSFWFLGRNRILLSLFQQHVGDGECDVLEIGCGTGFVLSALARRFPGYRLLGAEIYTEGLEFARERVPSAQFCQLDAARMPFRGAFDAAGAFDVLEHIDDDEAVLKGLNRALKPQGSLLITVPQHPWLWSQYDEAGHHKRRYSRPELLEKVARAGFRTIYASSFVTLLLPLMILNRRAQKDSGRPSESVSEQAMRDLAPRPVVNSLGALLLRGDELAMKLGISLPAGGSLVVVARKESDV